MPPVDPVSPRLLVDLRIGRDGAALGLDLGAGSLHQRGTGRRGRAPLREDVAAGLAHLAAVDSGTPLLDPFCGTGTFLAEAFAVAHGLPAGRHPARTALIRLPAFRELPLSELAAAERATPPEEHPPVRGSDADPAAVDAARQQLARLGLDESIRVRVCTLDQLQPPRGEAGLILTNPPWGLRLDEGVEESWHALGQFARQLPGWQLAALCGDPALSRQLGLKASRRHPVRIAGIDTRLLMYTMRAPR